MQIKKELILLRHGKSDWNAGLTDFYRPLNKRGERDSLRIGVWLKEQNLQPSLVICSSAIRAMITAEMVCEAMGIMAHSIQTEKSIYQASLSDLQRILINIPDSIQRLLLVGHNPSIESLLVNLVPNVQLPADGKLMPTATLAYLQLDSHWASLQGQFWVMRPKDLPD